MKTLLVIAFFLFQMNSSTDLKNITLANENSTDETLLDNSILDSIHLNSSSLDLVDIESNSEIEKFLDQLNAEDKAEFEKLLKLSEDLDSSISSNFSNVNSSRGVNSTYDLYTQFELGEMMTFQIKGKSKEV